MTEPLKVTISVSSEDQPGQAPAPRTEQQPYAERPAEQSKHEPSGLTVEQKDRVPHKKGSGLFKTGSDQWHGHFGQFTVTRRSQTFRHLGRAAHQLMQGNLGSAGSHAGQALGLSLGQSQAGSSVAAFATGAGAGAGMAAAGGLAVGALMKLAEWTEKASGELQKMAERGAAFSGEVAVAFAQANVRRTLFELEQARKYGPVEAAGVEARSILGIEWDRITNKLTASFGEVATNLVVKPLGKLLSEINEALGLKKADDERSRELQLQQVAGLTMLADLIGRVERFAEEGNPAAEWMKNNRHFELKDIGLDHLDMFIEHGLDFEPFRGGIKP